jgi:hypothetical protein
VKPLIESSLRRGNSVVARFRMGVSVLAYRAFWLMATICRETENNTSLSNSQMIHVEELIL